MVEWQHLSYKGINESIKSRWWAEKGLEMLNFAVTANSLGWELPILSSFW